jgi:hypothetical protein
MEKVGELLQNILQHKLVSAGFDVIVERFGCIH